LQQPIDFSFVVITNPKMAEPEPEPEPGVLKVGDRVQSDGSLATVRYIGPVAGQDAKKVWIGVEWDEPGRGKNDGSTGGERYFECGASQGSFLKERKVEPRRALADAIVHRYCGGESYGDAADAKGSRGVVIDSGTRMTARFVGMQALAAQQSDLSKLQHVALMKAGVNRVSAAGQPPLGELAPNIQELDLAENLLKEWSVVEELGLQLPNLQSLDLRANRLLAAPCAGLAPFQSLRVLVLNATGLSWADTVSLSPQMPRLAELHVAGNGISSLAAGSPLPEAFPVLEQLDLDNNQLNDWSEVARLADLPCLVKLTLSANQIDAISIDPPSTTAGGPPPAFAQLQSLYITRNTLSKADAEAEINRGCGWSAVAALDNLPSLRDLRGVGNPLFEMPSCEPALAREWIIGRVSQLTHLDGSTILPEDRVMGEKKYLRQCHVELYERGGKASVAPPYDPAFLKQHPRFEALNQLYEDVQHEKRGADASKSKLSSNLVELTIKSPIDAHAEKEPVVKRVTLSMSVGKLKALCQRLFKVKGGPRHMKLTYVAPKQEQEQEQVKQVELEEWDSDLQYYSVESGGTVIVESTK
jgi:Leucine-rich repeat (LRR) protein